MLAKFTPHDADVRARSVLKWFVAGQVDSAMPRLVPQLIDANSRLELEKVAKVFDGRPIDSMRVIGAQTSERDGVRHANLSYEMHSSAGWIAANVATIDTGGHVANGGRVRHTHCTAARRAQPLLADR